MLAELPRHTARAIIAVVGVQRIAVFSEDDHLTFALRDEGVESFTLPNAASATAGFVTFVVTASQTDAVCGDEADFAIASTIIFCDLGEARATVAARMRPLGWAPHPRSCRAPGLLVLTRPQDRVGDLIETMPTVYDVLSNFIRAGDLVLTAGVTPKAQEILSANSGCRAVKQLGFSAREDGANEDEFAGLIVLNCLADAAFATVEHANEAWRRLAPGGRLALIRSSDALPATFDVVTSFGEAIIIERAFAILQHGVEECDPWDPPVGPVITLAVRSPLYAGDIPYTERAFRLPNDPCFCVVDFASAYKFPAIVRALVTRGERITTPDALVALSHRVLPELKSGSVDRGAVLCALGYQALEMISAASILEHLLAEIADWLNQAGVSSGHTLRWRLSLLALTSKMHQRLGRSDDALAAAEACAALDPLPFSPLLAARTIEALFFIATIKVGRCDMTGAVKALDRAIRTAREATHADWINVIGDWEAPLPFGLYELGTVLNLASRCAVLRGSIGDLSCRPGRVWEHAAILSREVVPGSSPATDIYRPSASARATVASARSLAAEGYRLAELAQRRGDQAIEDLLIRNQQEIRSKVAAEERADQTQQALDALRASLVELSAEVPAAEDGRTVGEMLNAAQTADIAAAVRKRLRSIEQQLNETRAENERLGAAAANARTAMEAARADARRARARYVRLYDASGACSGRQGGPGGDGERTSKTP